MKDDFTWSVEMHSPPCWQGEWWRQPSTELARTPWWNKHFYWDVLWLNLEFPWRPILVVWSSPNWPNHLGKEGSNDLEELKKSFCNCVVKLFILMNTNFVKDNMGNELNLNFPMNTKKINLEPNISWHIGKSKTASRCLRKILFLQAWVPITNTNKILNPSKLNTNWESQNWD